jgi:hypothetical protein
MLQSLSKSSLLPFAKVVDRFGIPTGDQLRAPELASFGANLGVVRRNTRTLFRNCWTSVESGLCVPARRKHEADKNAKALEVYNAEFSTIYRLPPELILDIFDYYLTIADILALRQSCRRYASLTRHIIPHKLLRIDRPDFKARLSRDRFYKLADAEPFEVDRLDTLLCSYCQSPHAKSMFQYDEIHRTARTRKCVGLTRGLRLCRHFTLKYQDILAYRAREERIGCSEARHGHCDVDPHISGWKSRDKRVLCFGYIYRGLHAGKSSLSRQRLQDISKELATRLCPHMSMDGPEFQCKLKESDARLMGTVGLSVWSSPVIFAPASRSTHMTISCSEEHCHTDVDIWRWADISGGLLDIKIYRDLGQIETPLDPMWIAQLQA